MAGRQWEHLAALNEARRTLSDAAVRQIRLSFYRDGVPPAALALVWPVDLPRIYRILDGSIRWAPGFPYPRFREYLARIPHPNTRRTPELIAYARQLRAEGLTYKDIAAHLATDHRVTVTQMSVWHWLNSDE